MIDFQDRNVFDSARRFLARFRHNIDDVPPDALADLSSFLLSRKNAEDELVTELCGWKDRELEGFLRACWQSEIPEALAIAAAVLRERGTTGLVPWIESLTQEQGGARWLVDVLADVADDDASRILLQLLDHATASVRGRAADGLAAHRSHLVVRPFLKTLATPLVRGLSHPDPFAAIRALHRIADAALEPDFGKDAARRAERILIQCVRHETRSEVRGDAIAALGEVGSRAAVRCLVEMLSQEDRAFHRDVVIALRKIRPEKAVIALLGLLQSPDPIIREEAAHALGAIGDRQAITRLRELMDDENADVRQEAVLALGRLGGVGILRALERALGDSDPAVRMTACAALAQGLGPGAQGRLIRALYDESPAVRGEAAFLLGVVGDASARVHLESRLNDRERDTFGEMISTIARKSLNRLRLAQSAA